MILVDTSVWVRHLRFGDTRLSTFLNDAEVACHPFIIEELACGHLHNRSEILSLLQSLPQVPVIDEGEFLELVERRHLDGRGIGYIDVHLLGSALLSGLPLWTLDRRLHFIAREKGCGAQR
ncbi:MAG: PIN domain-containing protein [Acidobacteriia bacterium]|nr:PIN domain-containing protein [Terriglobia bacterium]